jgi:hypothetical protein
LSSSRIWFSESLLSRAPIPVRKIHLDFHNSRHIGSVGHGFNSERFINTLRSAHADAIVVFAKDMHGYFYYPSSFGPVHPGLQGRDLLGEQVAACREAGIKVFAYYCTTWDNHLAELHPEWLSLKRDRTSYLPKFDEPPGWTALCMSNRGFVDLMLAHTREILERYDVDGLWFDMPLTNHDQECFCRNCVASLRGAGVDIFDRRAQGSRTQELLLDWMRASSELAAEIRPGIIVDQNQQTRLGLAERAEFLSNVDIEALPTAHWGYPYYPLMARYVRSLEIPFTGLTGRFQTEWADFGGLKSKNQLCLEMASIVALGGGVSVGDQAPPSADLDRGVYDTIGAGYRYLADVEQYLSGAVPLTEAALLVDGPVVTDFARLESQVDPDVREGALGMARLLIEHRIQFDVVEIGTVELDRYGVLFLPDGLPLSDDTVAAVEGFLERGGRVVHAATPNTSLSSMPWLRSLEIDEVAPSPFAPTYAILTPNADSQHADFEFALYDGAARWHRSNEPDATVIATLGEPEFQRSAEHYTSHGQSPVHSYTDFVAVAANSEVAAFAFPVGTSYQRHGYWIYSELFGQVLRRVLNSRLVESDAPPSLELSLTYRPSRLGRPARLIVHAVNFTAASRRGDHLEYFDHVAPIHEARIRLRLGVPCRGVHAARSGQQLSFSAQSGFVEFTVPVVEQSELIVVELESDLVITPRPTKRN